MTSAARLILAIILLIVAGFCIFGFLSTFEPANRNIAIWRAAYGAIAALAVIGAIWVARLALSRKSE